LLGLCDEKIIIWYHDDLTVLLRLEGIDGLVPLMHVTLAANVVDAVFLQCVSNATKHPVPLREYDHARIRILAQVAKVVNKMCHLTTEGRETGEWNVKERRKGMPLTFHISG